MSLEVKNTKDMTNIWLATLVYGGPKTGKTTFTAGLGAKPLVVDFDDGVLTLRDLAVNYVQPRTWEEILLLTTEIRSGKLREKVDFDHIIWDSHTFFYSVVMEGVLRIGKRTQPAIQDWGLANDRVKLIYDQLKGARNEQKYHFTVICHEKIDKDNDTGKLYGGIAATPELMAKVPAMFDELYYVKVNTALGASGQVVVKYNLSTVPEGMFNAGSRSRGRLLPIETQDFKALYAKITGPPPQGGK